LTDVLTERVLPGRHESLPKRVFLLSEFEYARSQSSMLHLQAARFSKRGSKELESGMLAVEALHKQVKEASCMLLWLVVLQLGHACTMILQCRGDKFAI
jgi:hypothetical protein